MNIERARMVRASKIFARLRFLSRKTCLPCFSCPTWKNSSCCPPDDSAIHLFFSTVCKTKSSCALRSKSRWSPWSDGIWDNKKPGWLTTAHNESEVNFLLGTCCYQSHTNEVESSFRPTSMIFACYQVWNDFVQRNAAFYALTSLHEE